MVKYVLFDTETTGKGEEDRIIQVGAMFVHSRDNIEVLDEFCLAPIPISIEAMEVHNITPEMIENKCLYNETKFADKINEFNKPQNYLIAHNISFDLNMLEKEGFENKYTLIDTLRCARHLLEQSPYHRLQYLRYSLGLYKDEKAEASKLAINIKAHDAIGDVLIMKLLLSYLVKEVQKKYIGINPMVKLAELTKKPILIKTFSFGKYKDKNISDIIKENPNYIKWMQKNMDLDEDMIYSLNYYLNA